MVMNLLILLRKKKEVAPERTQYGDWLFGGYVWDARALIEKDAAF